MSKKNGVKKNNGNKKSKKKIIIILVILVVIATFIVQKTVFNKQSVNLEDQSLNKQVEITAEKGEIKVSVTGSGSVEPADKRNVKSEVDGTIDKIYVSEGQLVEEDELILDYQIESDDESEQLDIQKAKLELQMAQSALNDLYDEQSDLKIYADESGTIQNLDFEVGDGVNKNSSLFNIKNVDTAKVDVNFNEAQFNSISIGDSASVFFPDYLTYQSGKVIDMNSSPVPLGSGAVGYTITIEIENVGAMEKGIKTEVTVENASGSYLASEKGEIVENDKVSVKAETNGEISKLYVKNGQYVNKNDLLLEVIDSDLEYSIEQQKIQVQQKKLALNDLQEVESVYSPISGTILSLRVDEEEAVDRLGQLATVADLNNMEIIIGVDELDIIKIEEGQKVSITCDVFENEKFEGTVSNISLEGNSSNGVTAYDVTITLDERKELMSGMNVDVEILVADKKDALLVPIEALQKIQTKYVVMVKNEDGENTPKPVVIGLANEDYVEIVSGIEEGDTIVYMKEALNIDDANMKMMMPGMGGGGKRPAGGGKEE